MRLNGMPLCYSKQTLTAWQTTFVRMRTELLGVYMLNMDRLLHNNVLIYCNGLSCSFSQPSYTLLQQQNEQRTSAWDTPTNINIHLKSFGLIPYHRTRGLHVILALPGYAFSDDFVEFHYSFTFHFLFYVLQNDLILKMQMKELLSVSRYIKIKLLKRFSKICLFFI